MCGRFTITVSIADLMLRYFIATASLPSYQPRYNAAPLQMIPAVIHDGRQNRLGQLRWGLVPSWAKDERMAGKMINARAETLLQKPSFKHLISRKRCVIPADSFYEWKRAGGKKQPMRIMMKDGRVFSLAGLYDIWTNPATGEKLGTFTMITTSPNELVAEIHSRMPVILDREGEAMWLDRSNTDGEALMELLRPYPAQEMKAYAVSPIVGNVKNDGPECIAETEEG
jgi:putative SOS response-associated peptidase YedK